MRKSVEYQRTILLMHVYFHSKETGGFGSTLGLGNEETVLFKFSI
jgi:hypothetical protein